MIKIKTNASVNLMKADAYVTMTWLGYACALAANDLHHIHLCAEGDKFQEIHESADKYLATVRELGDFCLELAKEGGALVCNETNALALFNAGSALEWTVQEESSYQFDTAFEAMSDILSTLAWVITDIEDSALLTPDVASELDNYLREFTKEVNYFIAKKLSK